MLKKLTLSLTAAIASLAPAATTAQTGTTKSITVNINDLDLSSPKGQKRMTNRIKIAARVICGNSGGRTVADINARKECVHQVMASTQSQTKQAITKASSRHATNIGSIVASRK